MLRRTLLVSTLAPALATISCSDRRLTERAKLRVAASPFVVSAPFYVAYEDGYFQQEGLDIELMKEMPSLQSIPLLAAGRQDVGFVGLTAGFLNAVARGARVRLVAAREIVSAGCPLAGMIYVRAKDFPNGVEDMRQLRHHKVSVTTTTATPMFGLDKLLEHAGMSRSDIQIPLLSANERVPGLRSGSVDAIVVTSLDLTPMLERWQIARGPGLAEVLPGFQLAFIAFGARLLDGDVRKGAAFLRAYLKGLRDFVAGKTPRFLDEYAKSNDWDPQLVRAGCRDTYQNDGTIDTKGMQAFIDWAASHGDIPQSMTAGSVIDTRFLDAQRGAA